MIENFFKYWEDFLSIIGVLVIVVILDLRYKMVLVNYYYPNIYIVGL